MEHETAERANRGKPLLVARAHEKKDLKVELAVGAKFFGKEKEKYAAGMCVCVCVWVVDEGPNR